MGQALITGEGERFSERSSHKFVTSPAMSMSASSHSFGCGDLPQRVPRQRRRAAVREVTSLPDDQIKSDLCAATSERQEIPLLIPVSQADASEHSEMYTERASVEEHGRDAVPVYRSAAEGNFQFECMFNHV